jgi:eukaryotic-like serine/threonine-protein kinase
MADPGACPAVTDAGERDDRAEAYRLFSEALECNPAARSRLLEQRCAGRPALRAAVIDLLEIATRDNAATSALLPTPAAPQEQLSGQVVGRYKLQERLGEGGMGVVYRAVRTDEVQQSVAVKLLSSFVTDAVQRRFEREAQILARLEHPAIARLIDAGIRDHRPWMAMEFVQGERIDAFCAVKDLSVRQIVQLLVLLAGAVAAAHRLLVVHSDIKPNNVLVTADGSPKLIDFGISTALREAGAGAGMTVDAGRLFSPGYAAPEQITGEPITVATDVFGLGALAYRLLTGRPPYSTSDNPLDYLLAVTQKDLEPAGRISQALRGDLDAILGKCLRRDPQQRYASAGDLQADLQRFLERRPITARPASPGYRLSRFLRRNALASALAAIAIVSILSATVGLAWQAHELAMQRDAARTSASRAQRVSRFLVSMMEAADPQLGGKRDVTVAEILDAGSRQTRTDLADDPQVRAQMQTTIARTDYSLGRYQAGLTSADDAIALLEAGTPTLALVEARHIKGKLQGELGDKVGAAQTLRLAIAELHSLPNADSTRAAVMKDLGMVLSREADLSVAEALFRDAIAIWHRLGVDDAEYGDALVSLGEILQRDGRFVESLRLEQDGHAMMLRHESPDNPDALGADLTIAEALQSLGRYPEAEVIHRRLLTARERVLGQQHVDTLISKLSLSANLRMQQRYEEALRLAHEAADDLAKQLGERHRLRLFAQSTLGLAECAGGDAAAGLAAAQAVLRVRTELYGAGDKRSSLGRVVEALCLAHDGHRAQARLMLSQETAWRPIAVGSYADIPRLVEQTLR